MEEYNLTVIKVLLNYGYQLNDELCYLAAAHGHLKILKYLQSVNCKYHDDLCYIASKYGNSQVLDHLIKNGCNLNKTSKYDPVLEGHLEMVDFMKDSPTIRQRKKLNYNISYNVKVGPSLIRNAGNGVFACRDFKKGEILCFYDGEVVNKNDATEHKYSMEVPNDSEKVLIGFKIQKSDGGVGQLINDGSMFTINSECSFKLSDERIDRDIESYKVNSLSMENCHIGSGNNIYAKCNISSGSELYTTYGIVYWIGEFQIECEYPLCRLFCLLKTDPNIREKYDSLKIIKTIGLLPNGNFMNTFNLAHLSNDSKLDSIIKMIE